MRSGASAGGCPGRSSPSEARSEEHTSELQSRSDLVCRLLLEKKKKNDVRDRNVLTLDYTVISIHTPPTMTRTAYVTVSLWFERASLSQCDGQVATLDLHRDS